MARVILSSIWRDLQPERQAVERVLHRMRETLFAGMEYFGSRPGTPREVSLAEVNRADIYVGIFAGRYGSGITHQEYRLAHSRRLPCLIYIKDDSIPLTADQTEASPDLAKKLSDLKRQLRRRHTIATFTSPDDLAAQVAADLHRLLGEIGRGAGEVSPASVPETRSAAGNQQVGITTGAQTGTREKPFGAPPLPPQGVFGREQTLAELREALALDDPDTDAPPLAIWGMAGIGKTTLVIALAHTPRLLERFPDGVLWSGLGPRPSLRHQRDLWGRAIGADLLPLPDDAACSQRLRDVLSGRRMLLIVDDLWEVAHGRLFLVGGSQCRTVVTTRELPVASDLVTRARVHLARTISPEAALALLQALVPEVVESDESAARRLCERLEYLPLALTLAGRYLANAVDVPRLLTRLVSELTERTEAALDLIQSEGRPGLRDDGPVSLRAILGMSVERLDRGDQERFAMLSVFGGEPLSWTAEAAAAVWECSIDEAERTILRLVQRGLVDRWGNRYRMHALLADYAAALAREWRL